MGIEMEMGVWGYGDTGKLEIGGWRYGDMGIL
jgi:hypothetical protein